MKYDDVMKYREFQVCVADGLHHDLQYFDSYKKMDDMMQGEFVELLGNNLMSEFFCVKFDQVNVPALPPLCVLGPLIDAIKIASEKVVATSLSMDSLPNINKAYIKELVDVMIEPTMYPSLKDVVNIQEFKGMREDMKRGMMHMCTKDSIPEDMEPDIDKLVCTVFIRGNIDAWIKKNKLNYRPPTIDIFGPTLN